MQLLIANNSATNPQSMDLTDFIKAALGEGMDPAAPTYSDRVFAHSLLKEGGTFTLENANLKELVFPLLLTATTSSVSVQLVAQINQIIQTPGATASWQDDALTQATLFSLSSGQCDIDYDYRKAQAHSTQCRMRLFTQPFGTTPATRFLAAASGVGPLLMISPFANGGGLAITPSTQAGIAGFGGKQQASGGVFYGGNPSLAGDAPALLQVSFTGPLPVPGGTTGLSAVPYTAVSVLPDQYYQPLIPASQLASFVTATASTAVGSTYAGIGPNNSVVLSFYPFAGGASTVPALWAGNHRLFALARATQSPGFLQTLANQAVPFTTTATVTTADWSLYDLGTFTLRASQTTPQINVFMQGGSALGAAKVMQVTACVMLPENSTWYLNPTAIQPSQYGYPGVLLAGQTGATSAYSNTLLLDDTLPDQFVYSGASITRYTPSPAGMVGSSSRISSFTRGVVPRPDPGRGLPIIAVLSVAQSYSPSQSFVPYPGGLLFAAGASWINSQQLATMAQVNVLERTRYVFP